MKEKEANLNEQKRLTMKEKEVNLVEELNKHRARG
jgi:hypothetical protein